MNLYIAATYIKIEKKIGVLLFLLLYFNDLNLPIFRTEVTHYKKVSFTFLCFHQNINQKGRNKDSHKVWIRLATIRSAAIGMLLPPPRELVKPFRGQLGIVVKIGFPLLIT